MSTRTACTPADSATAPERTDPSETSPGGGCSIPAATLGRTGFIATAISCGRTRVTATPSTHTACTISTTRGSDSFEKRARPGFARRSGLSESARPSWPISSSALAIPIREGRGGSRLPRNSGIIYGEPRRTWSAIARFRWMPTRLVAATMRSRSGCRLFWQIRHCRSRLTRQSADLLRRVPRMVFVPKAPPDVLPLTTLIRSKPRPPRRASLAA